MIDDRATGSMPNALILRAKCGLEKLQPVILQRSWLRTLMKDARGGLIR